jgi:hypothetical protein
MLLEPKKYSTVLFATQEAIFAATQYYVQLLEEGVWGKDERIQGSSGKTWSTEVKA